ncbi:MAG: DinB family protein [Candidatus Acidiferrum sp.]
MNPTDISKLKASWGSFEHRMLTFVRELTREKLDTVFEYKTMKFGIYRNSLWQSMQYLVNHGTYHRGQITTMLRQLGAQPILTDLMHFYREHAAAAGA